METQLLLPEIINIAKNAGKEILNFYHADTAIAVHTKSDNSPLTQADITANQVISEHLKELTHFPILSEESPVNDFHVRKQWETYWLIDPLDGTKEFIQKTDEFTINIALIHNRLPILGVVHAPALDLCYFASEHGAFKQEKEQPPHAIRTRKITENALTIVASRRHGLAQLQSFLHNLGSYSIVNRGSALKCCLVAEGAADLYPRFGPTSEWDTAAGQCILDIAGGAIIDFRGNPLVYNEKSSLINPSFLALGDKHFNWQKYLENFHE